jgi:molecular chaperone DnaJ
VEKRDYYKLLGISPNATEVEIKKAYRILANQYHPDKNQGDPRSELLFKEIVEAYNVLLNPRDRALYEQFGHALTPTNIIQKEKEEFDLVDVVIGATFDFLNGFLRNKNGGRFQAVRGDNHKYTIELSFKDAVHGKKMPLSYKRLQACDSCKGTGAQAGTQPLICPRCQGKGEERKIGSLMAKTTCIGCNGKGQVIPEPCSECSGDGRTRKVRNITIFIPPGTEDGDIIRVQSEGEMGNNGGPNGDLYVTIKVK